MPNSKVLVVLVVLVCKKSYSEQHDYIDWAVGLLTDEQKQFCIFYVFKCRENRIL